MIGCGEWGFRDRPMEDHFRIAARFGFKVLEFGIGGGRVGRLPEHPSESDVASFRRLAQNHGIRTPYCCIENDFTLPDAAAHAAMLDKVLGQLPVAAACGATHVRLFAGFTPADQVTSQIQRRMIDAFGRCAASCRDLGLVIAIETHGAIQTNEDGSATHSNSVTTDRACLANLIRDLPPDVGFNYDPGNIKAVFPDDPRYALDLLNERIVYCHLKDWVRSGRGWVAAAVGDGDLDYGPIFRAMHFDGVCLIEYEPLHDTEDGIRRSLAYLEKMAPGFVREP